MEYHADKFEDHSLVAYQNNIPIALLPANSTSGILQSHQGLTLGGWIIGHDVGTATMLSLFDCLKNYMHSKGLHTLRYKAIPYLYHTTPAQEDIYALFRNQSNIAVCNVAAVIDNNNPQPFTQRRLRGRKKALQHGIVMREDHAYEEFFAILQSLLHEKYQTIPVHTCQEMKHLVSLFPKNIRLYAAYRDETMLAGVIVYESTYVARAQYIASNAEGRTLGALDALFWHLVHEVYNKKRYFDFGTSNEQNGMVLNESLIQYKEEFGAHAVAYETYEIKIG